PRRRGPASRRPHAETPASQAPNPPPPGGGRSGHRCAGANQLETAGTRREGWATRRRGRTRRRKLAASSSAVVLPELADLEDDQLVGSPLLNREPDPIAGMKRRLIEEIFRLCSEHHRPHFRHEPRNRVVPDQDHLLTGASLEHTGDAVETLGGQRLSGR